MKKLNYIFRSIVLVLILVLLLIIKEFQTVRNVEDCQYISDKLDVGKSKVHYFSLDKESWPQISDIENNILEVDLILKSSDDFSCRNDIITKSSLVFAISDSAHYQSKNYNRLLLNQEISDDTLFLSKIIAPGQTKYKDYHFSIPIAYISYIKNENSTFYLDIIKGDSLINQLEPRIQIRKFDERFADSYFNTVIFNVCFYALVLLVLMLFVFEIIFLSYKRG